MHALPTLACLALWASACSQAPCPPAAPEPAAAAPETGCTLDNFAKPLDVISRGAEPRRVLGYRACTDCREHAMVTMEGRFEQRFLSPPYAPDERFDMGRFRARLTVTLSAGGRAERRRYSLGLSDAEFLPVASEALPADGSPKMAERISLIEATRGGAEVDGSGRTHDPRIEAADTAVLEVYKDLLELAVPFPDVPIGVGARWRFIGARVTENARAIREIRTFELTAADGDVLDITVLAREAAEPEASKLSEVGHAPGDGSERGAGMRRSRKLLWSSGTRESRLRVRLGRLVPEKQSDIRRVEEHRVESDCTVARYDYLTFARLEIAPFEPVTPR
jgi:hypothetical protein